MNKKPLTRREFLRIAGITMGAAGLAACAPQIPALTSPTAPSALKGPLVLKVMYTSADFPADQQAQFEATHPNIKLDFYENDSAALIAMFAAGNPPDLFESSASILPRFLTSKLVMDLEPFIAGSKVIKKDDLAPCYTLLKYDGKTTGQGDIYGMALDWSPDFTLWINTGEFEKAGVPVPPDDQPLTYTEVMDIARKLTIKQGDRTLQWGFGSQAMTWGWTFTILECLAQLGEKLYSPDFKKMVLVDNPDAVKIVKYWFDMAKEDLCPNPLDPTSTSEDDEFSKGKCAMVQFGYWMSPEAETDITRGKVMMLPAPNWGGNDHRDPCATATCSAMCSQTKVSEAAWEFIEWFHAGQRSIDHAKSGWGVPGLKSFYKYMPNQTPYQQQVQKVLANEMKVSNHSVAFNPYYDAEGTNDNVWKTNLEQGLRGTISFDEMLKNIEKANNDAIDAGVRIVS